LAAEVAALAVKAEEAAVVVVASLQLVQQQFLLDKQ
jgi:hypothetical protein